MNTGVTELQSSMEARYRLLLDSITDYAIYLLDAQGFVSSWNTGALRSKGYTEVEILGAHFSRFFLPADRQSALPEKMLATAAAEGHYEGEGWRLRKDGSHYWAQAVIHSIRDSNGVLIGFAKITRDLTERKKAEAELHQSEQQFRLLVQGVTDYALYMLDHEGRVSSWNIGAQRTKGYLPEEIIGEHFSRFYTAEDRAAGLPATALATAAREGRFETEGWRLRKDGSRFWASVVIDAIRDESGALLGFAKITRDVTEKKEARAALDRTREDLFQAQKMEAVGQLTSGMAHDFNNLLMAVLGSLELARKRIPDGLDISALIDNATRAAQRGAALTQRLLAFSRSQQLSVEDVDISELVRGMTDLMQRAIGPSVEVETRFPLALPKVRADANQLESALLNLAVNARDAMPNGGRLIIAARVQQLADGDVGLKEGRYLCLSLQDEGEGMDAETLTQAAAPFFTTKGIGKGTGLGLPMVQGLMAQLGGKLVLSSQQGIGTTAELWIPVVIGAGAPVLAPAIELPRNLSGPLRILAVDDDALVLMNTVMMLEDLGHTVFEAHSGDEALAMLAREGTVDLVVTDHAMPRMTGTQLADAIRLRQPDLPVLLATGYAELPPGGNAELMRLAKPFTQAQLAEMVATAVAKAQSRV